MPFLAEQQLPIPTKDLLSWIFDDVQYNVDMPIYTDAATPLRSLSCRQAGTTIRKLVAGLRAAGLKQGDCVCISSFNDIFYSMLFLGIIAAGGVFTGTNPSYTEFELIHHIKTSKASFLIAEPELLDNVRRAASECDIPNQKILIFNVLGQKVPAGFKSWEDLLTHGEEDWVRFDDLETCRVTTAARLFSSGTTGLPKAAELTHYNFIAQHTLVHEAVPKPYEVRRTLALPMFHAAAVPTYHTTALRSGHPCFVMRRFELHSFLASFSQYNITEIAIVPPMAVAMIMSPITKNYDLSSMKSVTVGAAPLAKETQGRLKKLLAKECTVTQVWGMTEACCLGTMFAYPEDDDTGSVGRMIPNMDVKLVDDNGNDISAYDVRGELCIRGPTVTPAYLDNPTANAASFDSDSYFRTGDIAFVSSTTKKWYIVDRKKELIKVRGFQVAPPEIEAVLLAHPGIVDAAVIGVKGPGGSENDEEEFPRAFVVRKPGWRGVYEGVENMMGEVKLGELEVKAWCAYRLARYKALTGGVVFVDAIPKNASGKILKRLLREWVIEEKEKEKERGSKL